jgi:hypothetical protein
MLFFAYVVGWIVVTAPILNSTLREELRRHDRSEQAEPPGSSAAFPH